MWHKAYSCQHITNSWFREIQTWGGVLVVLISVCLLIQSVIHFMQLCVNANYYSVFFSSFINLHSDIQVCTSHYLPRLTLVKLMHNYAANCAAYAANVNRA